MLSLFFPSVHAEAAQIFFLHFDGTEFWISVFSFLKNSFESLQILSIVSCFTIDK